MMDQPDQPEQSGYCICLHVAADGGMVIDVEPEAEEMQEEQAGAGEAQEPAGTPVKGLKEAIAKIIEIVSNGGQVEGTGGEEDFAGGFNEDTTGAVAAPAKRFA